MIKTNHHKIGIINFKYYLKPAIGEKNLDYTNKVFKYNFYKLKKKKLKRKPTNYGMHFKINKTMQSMSRIFKLLIK